MLGWYACAAPSAAQSVYVVLYTLLLDGDLYSVACTIGGRAACTATKRSDAYIKCNVCHIFENYNVSNKLTKRYMSDPSWYPLASLCAYVLYCVLCVIRTHWASVSPCYLQSPKPCRSYNSNSGMRRAEVVNALSLLKSGKHPPATTKTHGNMQSRYHINTLGIPGCHKLTSFETTT
jgi:hypothetical protein